MSPKINTAPKYQVKIECVAPLHHGAFGLDTGNAVAFLRMPIASAPQRAGIPVISGNSLKNILRRIVLRDLLQKCDLRRGGIELEAAEWDKLYGAIANGGNLKGSESHVSSDNRRWWRDVLPPSSLFGASVYTWMLSGKISVGWLYPVCEETVAAGYCDPIEVLRAAEDLVSEISLVRHIDRDWQDPEISGVTPMPISVECLIPGTVLTSEIIPLAECTPIEMGSLGYGLNMLRHMGGKVGIGFGRVKVEHNIDAQPYIDWLADPKMIEVAKDALVRLGRESTPDITRSKSKLKKAEKAAAVGTGIGLAGHPILDGPGIE